MRWRATSCMLVTLALLYLILHDTFGQDGHLRLDSPDDLQCQLSPTFEGYVRDDSTGAGIPGAVVQSGSTIRIIDIGNPGIDCELAVMFPYFLTDSTGRYYGNFLIIPEQSECCSITYPCALVTLYASAPGYESDECHTICPVGDSDSASTASTVPPINIHCDLSLKRVANSTEATTWGVIKALYQ